MTKREPKEKISIPTRAARPKGDMFRNLRRPEEVESLSIEEIVAGPDGGKKGGGGDSTTHHDSPGLTTTPHYHSIRCRTGPRLQQAG